MIGPWRMRGALGILVIFLFMGGLSFAQVAVLPFSEDFEGGEVLDAQWAVSGTGNFRTVPINVNTPHGGLWHLGMDDSVQNFAYSRNELTLTVNLALYDNVVLTFWAREFGDEPNGPPTAPFTDGADFDGVAISEDGVTWVEIHGLRDLSGTYEEIVVDLDAAVATHGLAYNSTFRIRFNQYDNHPIPGDGIALDDISISGDENADPTHIWVDFAYAGTEVGTELHPFNTLSEGAAAVDAGGTVSIKGDTATNTSPETLVLSNAMRLESVGGVVRIGE